MSAPRPWFADGLAFACTACGACCKREGDVFFTRDEAARAVSYAFGPDATPEAFAGELWDETWDGMFVASVPDGGACPFLGDDARCRIHPVKPAQCRTYPFWPEIVASARLWDAERAWCEGIGGDEVVSGDEIARQLNEADA